MMYVSASLCSTHLPAVMGSYCAGRSGEIHEGRTCERAPRVSSSREERRKAQAGTHLEEGIVVCSEEEGHAHLRGGKQDLAELGDGECARLTRDFPVRLMARWMVLLKMPLVHL